MPPAILSFFSTIRQWAYNALLFSAINHAVTFSVSWIFRKFRKPKSENDNQKT